MAEENVTISDRLAGCGKFVCNTEEGTFLGRTPKSWALIGIFYLIYYCILAAFFVGMLSVLLFGIVENDKPMLSGDHSLLKMNPGLGARPQPDVTTTLMMYNLKDTNSIKKMTDNLNEFHDKLRNISSIEGNRNCDLSNPEANRDFDLTETCKADPSVVWGDCKAPDFGYSNGTPCVIIKMNKIYGWLPETESMSNHSLLLCEGENSADKATIGVVEYFPSTIVEGKKYGYFSSAMFPYLNQKSYGAATVAIKFANIKKNVLVMVSCQLRNLKNVQYDKNDRQAMVRFEMGVMDFKE